MAAAAARRQAVAAYAAMWDAMQVAGLTADAAYPGLGRHASGQALASLRAGLASARKAGIIIRGQLVIHPAAVSVAPAGSRDPSQVAVSDCVDDTRWLNYVAATGRLQDSVPGGHRLTRAVVTRSGAGWKVTGLAVGAEGTC